MVPCPFPLSPGFSCRARAGARLPGPAVRGAQSDLERGHPRPDCWLVLHTLCSVRDVVDSCKLLNTAPINTLALAPSGLPACSLCGRVPGVAGPELRGCPPPSARRWLGWTAPRVRATSPEHTPVLSLPISQPHLSGADIGPGRDPRPEGPQLWGCCSRSLCAHGSRTAPSLKKLGG